MHNIFLLLKNYVNGFVGSLLKKRHTVKTGFAVLLCVAFSALLIIIFTANSISSTKIFLDMSSEYPGAERMSMFTNCAFAVIILLFITIMRSVYPTKHSDTELLLSLPFRKSEIVIAKSFYNYFFDLTIFLSILLPSYIVYYVMVPNTSFMVVIRGFIFILLLPLFSNAIATFVGSLCTKLAKVLKHYSLFQSLISIILIILYLVANYAINGYIEGLTGTVEEIISSVWIIDKLISYLLDNKLLFIFVLAAICIASYALSMLFLVYRLGKLDARYQSKSHELKFKKQSITKALVKKELKQYFDISVYLINTVIPGVLYFGLAVACCILGDKALRFLENFLQAFPDINKMYIVVMVFCILLPAYVITGSSISLEGKHFWVLRSNPISANTIFKAKILANLVLTGTVSLIGFPFLMIFVGDFNYWWVFLFIPFIGSITTSTLGLVINLNHPKLSWDREEAVIKSSLASLLSITLPFIITIIPFAVYFAALTKILKFGQFLIFDIIYLALIFLICVLWLQKKGEKALFEAENA